MMSMFSKFKEIYPNTEMLHGHGRDSARIPWGNLVVCVSLSPTADEDVDAVEVSTYSVAAWDRGDYEPSTTKKFENLSEAMVYVDGVTDA
jgi:hypothetical protein